MNRTITVSDGVLVRAGTILAACWFIYMIRDVVALFLVAIIITAAQTPVIAKLQQILKFNRTASAAVAYLLFFAVIGVLIAFIVPAVQEQLESFQETVPDATSSIVGGEIAASINFEDIADRLSGSFNDIFDRTIDVFTALVSIVAVISMSFYMSLHENGLRRAVLAITPEQHAPYVGSLIDRIQESFGRWVAGQLVTMIFVGTLYYILLAALGVPYALLLAIFGGLMEIVPYFGPILAAIPAAIMAYMVTPALALVVLVGYVVINFIENHILVPKIMNKAVGLDPVLVILALLVGAKLAGFVGVFLAVPLAGAVGVFVKDVIERRI